MVETDKLGPSDHVLVCPGTSHLVGESVKRCVLVDPTPENGLREATQFQVDKVTPARRERCSGVIGRLDAAAMEQIDERLMLVLGLAE